MGDTRSFATACAMCEFTLRLWGMETTAVMSSFKRTCQTTASKWWSTQSHLAGDPMLLL
jgi:hypothetical protein